MTTNGVSSSNTGAVDQSTTPNPGSSIANQDAFLQLLVAQIQNQNPLDPTDGVEFLSQLTQFSSLEQMMQVNSQLGDIKAAVLDLEQPAKP